MLEWCSTSTVRRSFDSLLAPLMSASQFDEELKRVAQNLRSVVFCGTPEMARLICGDSWQSAFGPVSKVKARRIKSRSRVSLQSCLSRRIGSENSLGIQLLTIRRRVEVILSVFAEALGSGVGDIATSHSEITHHSVRAAPLGHMGKFAMTSEAYGIR